MFYYYSSLFQNLSQGGRSKNWTGERKMSGIRKRKKEKKKDPLPFARPLFRSFPLPRAWNRLLLLQVTVAVMTYHAHLEQARSFWRKCSQRGLRQMCGQYLDHLAQERNGRGGGNSPSNHFLHAQLPFQIHISFTCHFLAWYIWSEIKFHYREFLCKSTTGIFPQMVWLQSYAMACFIVDFFICQLWSLSEDKKQLYVGSNPKCNGRLQCQAFHTNKSCKASHFSINLKTGISWSENDKTSFLTSMSLSNNETSNPSTMFTGAWNFHRSSNSTEIQQFSESYHCHAGLC